MDGVWEIRKLPHQGQIASLTAVDDQTIAWLQNDFICRLELTDDLSATNNPFVLLSQETRRAIDQPSGALAGRFGLAGNQPGAGDKPAGFEPRKEQRSLR